MSTDIAVYSDLVAYENSSSAPLHVYEKELMAITLTGGADPVTMTAYLEQVGNNYKLTWDSFEFYGDDAILQGDIDVSGIITLLPAYHSLNRILGPAYYVKNGVTSQGTASLDGNMTHVIFNGDKTWAGTFFASADVYTIMAGTLVWPKNWADRLVF